MVIGDGFGLYRPQLAFVSLGYDVDAAVGPPPVGPFAPRPDLAELPTVERRMLQIPTTDPFEVDSIQRAFGVSANLCLEVRSRTGGCGHGMGSCVNHE